MLGENIGNVINSFHVVIRTNILVINEKIVHIKQLYYNIKDFIYVP